jgi:hypothetical protein
MHWEEGGVAGSLPMSTAVHRSPNKLWRSNSIFNLCIFASKCRFQVLVGYKSIDQLYSFILRIKLYDLKTEVNQNKVKLKIK